MKSPTSVDIMIYVDESKNGNNRETQVFANGKAQVPITVYASINGGDPENSPEIVGWGLATKQSVTNLYQFPDDFDFPTLPAFLKDQAVNSVNERKYLAYQDLITVTPPEDTSFASRQTFLVTCSEAGADPNKLVQYELMGYVILKNYIPGNSGDPEDIVFFTSMDAKDSGGVRIQKDSYIVLEAYWKPTIKVKEPEKASLNSVDSNHKWKDDNGKIYYYFASYDDEKYTFKKKQCYWEMSFYKGQPQGKPFIEAKPVEGLEVAAFHRHKSGASSTGIQHNKVAYAIGDSLIEDFVYGTISLICQQNHKIYYKYETSKQGIYGGVFVGSASCFAYDGSNIQYDNLNMNNDPEEPPYRLKLFVEDVYGGLVMPYSDAEFKLTDSSTNSSIKFIDTVMIDR